jgi:uncharacterized membrane protein
MSKLWFKAKKYGFGWYPSTWQGWLVISIYVVIVGILVYIFETNIEKYLIPYIISITVLSLSLVYISYKKGEKASWRWGNKK